MAHLISSSVALITASSAGLGAVTAWHFASHGLRLIINYHSSAEKAQNLVDELGGTEQEKIITAIKADMWKRDEVERFVKVGIFVVSILYSLLLKRSMMECIRSRADFIHILGHSSPLIYLQ